MLITYNYMVQPGHMNSSLSVIVNLISYNTGNEEKIKAYLFIFCTSFCDAPWS